MGRKIRIYGFENFSEKNCRARALPHWPGRPVAVAPASWTNGNNRLDEGIKICIISKLCGI
jgi:hypothetical protein